MNTTDIRKQGFLRRLKTLKKRYFVLRTSSGYGKPRLEYHESEKKFRSNAPPKRLIYLASCFNIAQKDDTKHKFVFLLYTREDAFGLICESQDELKSWMGALLREQKISEVLSGNEYLQNDGGFPKSFSSSSMKRYSGASSHVSTWHVTVKPRGLGTSKNLAGTYLLQLANHTLSLLKTPSEEVIVEFHLVNVRRCGYTDCFFYMEVGRSSVTGAGELWMQVDDPILAQNLHDVVLLAMQSLSGGSSSLSRYRCHSGSDKKRPTSLLLPSPTRPRSDTDTSLCKQSTDTPSSPTKHPEENSPSYHRRPSAIFQRLLSVGKKRTEDNSPRFFSRQTQSKSMSIDPFQGGLLGRAQSLDFSRLFGGAELTSPESPESPKREINFDIDEEPIRTSSNSSGSSERSWEQTSSSVSPATHCNEEGRDEGYDSTRGRESTSKDNSTSVDGKPFRTSKSNDYKLTGEDRVQPDDRNAKENGGMQHIMASDDESDKREEQDNIHKDFVVVSKSDNPDKVETDQAKESRKNRSRYEDMTYNFEILSTKEKTDGDDVSSDESQPLTPPKEHFLVLSQNSPKQRRTSEPSTPNKYELRELVQIKNSPSPRRSNKNMSSLGSTNAAIAENPDSESDTTSRSRRRHNNRASNKTKNEYVVMSPQTGPHTYVNMTPGERLTGSEDDPATMNFRPGGISTRSERNSEQHSYMNFKPGEIPKENTGEELPSYMNFSPGSVTRSESVSPRPKRKHTYENLNLNGRVKVDEFESHDYMNFSPLGNFEDNVHTKAKSIPSSPRGSYGNLLNPAFSRQRRIQRRESEPIPSGLLSNEESGMLFLDFTKKSKPEKVLNYVSLDLSKTKKGSGGKGLNKNRPSSIDTIPCQKKHWDEGPKSLVTGYAEIDFAKSQGLRQAILEHEKTKPQKE